MPRDFDTEQVRKQVRQFRRGTYESDAGKTLDPDIPEDQETFADEVLGPYVNDVISAMEAGSITETKARRLLKAGIGSSDAALDVAMRYLWGTEVTQRQVEVARSFWPALADRLEAYVAEGTDETKRKNIGSNQGTGPTSGNGTVEDAQRPSRSETGGGDGGRGSADSPSRDAPATDTPSGSRDGAFGGAGGSGSDSGGDGTATSPKGAEKSGGDPLLLATGQFHDRTTDLAVAGRGLSFTFTRTYLSGATYAGPLGHNWDHNYNLWLREERAFDADGTPRNVVYRSSGDLREDKYVQRLDEPTGDLDPLETWQDATFDPPPGYFDRLEKSGGTYVLETVSGLRYEYNHEHYVDQIVDPNGNQLSFAYDDRNRLQTVTDPVGKEFRFEYDDHGRIAWLIDVVGDRRIQYEYGNNGDLIEVDRHYADRVASTDYRYAGPNAPPPLQHTLEEVVNAAGETVHENEYGTDPRSRAYGRVVRQWSRDGEYQYEYDIVDQSTVDPGVDPVDTPRRETRVTYPNGHVIAHQFNRQDNVVRRRERVREATGNVRTVEATFEYDGDAQLVAETLADGTRTEYVYARELYAERHGGTVAGATPAEELTFGNLRSTVRHPRPGTNESRRIVTEYTYHDRSAVAGAPLASVRGPYYANHRGAELPDQAVGTTTYEYDAKGNLLTVQPPDVERPDGTVVTPTPRTFSYDANGQVTTVAVGDSRVRHEYFTDRRRSGFRRRTVRDPDGAALATTFDVDDLGRETGRTGPYGARRDVTWTDFDRRESVTEPVVGSGSDRPTTTFVYDDAGRLVRRERELLDHEGTPIEGSPLVETFTQDRFGREVERTRGPVTDPNEHVRTRAYTRTNKVRRLTDWRGTVTRREYDERQRLAAVTRAVGTDAEFTVERRYDVVGRLVRETDGRGETSTRTYDGFGRLATVTRPDGTERRFEYDAAGRRTSERLVGNLPDGTSRVTWSESSREYDALGRVVREHAHLFDPGSASPNPRTLTTTRRYDADGNLVERTDPTGATTTYAYDPLGRRVERTGPDGTTVTTDFDDTDRRVTRTVARTGTGRDGDPTTHVSRTVRRLDEQGRPIAVVDAAGNERRIAYDSRGNQSERVDPTGTTYHSEYDVFGFEVAAVVEGARTTFGRDATGAVRRVTDPLGNTTVVDRDPLGNVTEVTRGSNTRKYGYDAGGNRIWIKDENGAVRERTFDAVGRLSAETFDRSAVTPPSGQPDYTPATRGRRTFVYTPAGDIARASNAEATVTREYDSLGRLVGDDIDGRRVHLSYDDGGRLDELTYPSGRTVEYEYSAGGVLESVNQTAPGSAYPGDPSLGATRQLLSTTHVGDRITGLDLDAVTTELSHDPRGLPVAADWSTDRGPLTSERRLYDARDACQFEQFDAEARLFDHDSRGRLIRATTTTASTLDVSELAPAMSSSGVDMEGQRRIRSLLPGPPSSPDRTRTYELDDNGNRTSRTETVDGTATRTTYDVGRFNRYDRIDGTDQVHDAAGNLLDDGEHSYRYDVRGRLVTVTPPDEPTRTYERDALGRLVAVDDGARKRLLTYAGDDLVDWRSVGSSSADGHLVHARSGVCHAATGSTDYVPVTDLAGSVRRWLDAADPTGAGAQRAYGPFGTRQSSQGTWPVPIGFRGYLEAGTDEVLGLRSRTYDPDRGRFLQRDPAGFADGPNQYTYARHAPTALTDRLGFQSVEPTNGTPADASPRSTDEWNPVRSGGAAFAAGGVGIGVGALILATGPVGWAGGLAAAMSLSSGFAGIGIGTAQVATSAAVDDRAERQVHRATQTALGFAGSPGAMIGGLGGLAYTGDASGLRTGSFYGGLAEGGLELGYGGIRLLRQEWAFERSYTGTSYLWPDRPWRPSVKRALRGAKGLDDPGGAARRFNPRFGVEEQRELSHLVPRRLYDDRAEGLWRTVFHTRVPTAADDSARLGDVLFNRPWNVRPMWKWEHSLVDPNANLPGAPVDTLPPVVRQWRGAPKQLQHGGVGGAKTGFRFLYSTEDDPKQ